MSSSTTPTDAPAGKLERTGFPAGGRSGWNLQPGEEVGYILAGAVKMEIRPSRFDR